MPLDAEEAALLVRVTARMSAGLLAANLLVGARRINRRSAGYRTADVRLFVAFIISHTIHFICVGLLALATNGANLDARLGYAPVLAVGVLFYIGCAGILRVKMRDGAQWSTPSQRNTEVWLLVAVWLGFAQAYVLRPLEAPLFAAIAILLIYSLVRFLTRTMKSEAIRSWQTLTLLILVLTSAACRSQTQSAAVRPPIIDMHLHAHSLSQYGGGMPNCANDQAILFPGVNPREPVTLSRLKNCSSPLPAAATDEFLMRESLALLERHNIFAVTTGPLANVRSWYATAPERVIRAHAFGDPAGPNAEEFRRLVTNGELAVFAEVSPAYEGRALSDASLEPYFALAEELDIPVGVHLGEGPPGAPYWAAPKYRATLASPFQVEDVLTRHPKLRLYVMHYGSPLVDEMIAVLFSHPQVYVDIAGNVWAQPRPHFYSQLRRLVEAGFVKRIMWGSDQMVWPRAIEVAVDTIEQAPFLNEEQKRDIFYNNAARFLRLTDEEMARHRNR